MKSFLPHFLRRPSRLAAGNLLAAVTHGLLARRGARGAGRVLVFKPDRIGDMMLAQGAIRVLHKHFHGGIKVVTSPAGLELCRTILPGTDVLAVPPFPDTFKAGFGAMSSEASRELFDTDWEAVVVLRHRLTPWQAFLLTKIKTKAVYAARREEMMDAHPWEKNYLGGRLAKLPWVFGNLAGDSDQTLEFKLHRAVLEAATGRAVPVDEVLPVITAPSQGREIVLAPLASAAFRDLPQPLLVKIGDSLLAAGAGSFFFPVAPADHGRAESYLRGLPARLVERIVLVKTPRIADLIKQLAAAGLVIAAESGPAHIATAMDRGILVVIGGGHFGLFAPWQRSNRQQWITNRLECFGCDWRCTRPTVECIQGVDAAQAAALAVDLWARVNSSDPTINKE